MVSCGNDSNEEIELTVENFEITIVENPNPNQDLGNIRATTNVGTIFYTIRSQSPQGALSIDGKTGNITVANAALFKFSDNPIITAIVEARNGSVSQSASVTIYLSEEDAGITVSIEDFEIVIYENPYQDQILGTVNASTNSGTLSFSILSQTPEGSLDIDEASGSLSVEEPSYFKVVTNPFIVATVGVANGTVIEEGTVTINLKEFIPPVAGGIMYNGPKIIFEKDAFANTTLAASQDRITPNVWITRNDNAGLFNAKINTVYISELGPPVDTEWAEGTLIDVENLIFTSWQTAVNSNPPGSVNKTYVVHLITDNIYLELTFLSWGQRNDGGNFSYERSTQISD